MRLKCKMPKSIKIDEIMLVLVVALIAIAVGVYEKISGAAEIKAEELTAMILKGGSFANNGTVDENRLREIQGMAYDDLKSSLGVKNDFCVYIEDGNGNIILAKGSSRLNNDGVVCKE